MPARPDITWINRGEPGATKINAAALNYQLDAILDYVEAVGGGPRRSMHTFGITSPEAKVYPGFFVSKAAGKTYTVVLVYAKTDTGTATVSVRKNGTTISGLGAIAVTSTAASHSAGASLAEGDFIDLNVTALVGAGGLSVTVVIEETET